MIRRTTAPFGKTIMAFVNVISVFFLPTFLLANVCPDKSTECPGGEWTCCESLSGHYGCCHMPNAVCCPDRQHCCPEGFKCHHDLCTRGTNVYQRFAVCPGGRESCEGAESTCCPSTESDGFSCCPMKDAVCCGDGRYCCPKGTRCDLKTGTCLQEEVVPCSSNFTCPFDFTCCLVPSGSWGCCPFPEAVCCSDMVHCCPKGSACGRTQCQQPLSRIRDIICPGGTYKCPDNTTCCQLAAGSWGCCPLPLAVCCPDKIHCCPQGYTCSGDSCVRTESGGQVKFEPLRLKVKALPLFT